MIKSADIKNEIKFYHLKIKFLIQKIIFVNLFQVKLKYRTFNLN
jgi:hypothetical protein